MPSSLIISPTVDSDAHAATVKRDLDIPRSIAKELGRSAVEISQQGSYTSEEGVDVNISAAVRDACARKVSIPPELPLPLRNSPRYSSTHVQVTNETTLVASQRLKQQGLGPVALNFANGIRPGGGFLSGARAQEEALCRSSALYATLLGDEMYDAHRKRPEPDSTGWCIYSPDVPIFRDDRGSAVSEPWLLSFITCAAPYAPEIGQPRSGDLLAERILRVLDVASAYGHSSLILGAWGCGAFKNDPVRTARDFRTALEGPFCGVFSDVIFAVTDWSPERYFFGPFRDVFASAEQAVS